MPPVLAPLTSATTVRAGVYLVIGGVLAGAYLTLAAGFVQMFGSPDTPRAAVVVLAVVTAAIVCAPPFLAPVRTLEVLAVRTFLDVDAADLPEPAGRPSAASRWRGAAWYALHLTLGAVVTLGLLVAVPLATQLVLSATGADRTFLVQAVPLITRNPAAWVALAVVLLLALPYLATGARAVLRQAAVPLLGPDQTARVAELEEQARRLAERGRLARELHDSVGHALTVTTLQAAAAARQLDADPEAARRSLAAIEETGRAAMADLDHVLGLLRGPEGPGPDAGRAPARTLADVPGLAEDAVRAGTPVRLDAADGVLAADGVPRAVAHEAYRVVQEALTNAVRHAPGAPVTVRVTRGPEAIGVEVTNMLTDAGPASVRPRRGGHGLSGMADRVRLLRGDLEAGAVPGPDGAVWRVRARLPLP